jgi:hypothetical protein
MSEIRISRMQAEIDLLFWGDGETSIEEYMRTGLIGGKTVLQLESERVEERGLEILPELSPEWRIHLHE